MFSTIKRLHFIGIGGIGMSGIAEILLNQGFQVSGSDMRESEITENLKSKGAEIFIGHKPENIIDAEVVVYSSAVNINENPETKEAMKRKIPIIRRAEMLAEVARLNYVLAVSGTHGKTTTSSIVGLILIKAGIDPTVIVGGRLRDFGGTNAQLGKGDWTVVEADEYDRSFLQLSPAIAIINNIEADHLDIYKDLDDIKDTFTEFANKVPFYGVVAVCLDDEGVKDILPRINKKVITYGLSHHCDIRAENINYLATQTQCNIIENNEILGELTINIPGKHNLLNSLAAISAARTLNIDFDVIKEAIADFKGVYRRFDILGEKNGVLIIDDYAHHPTEVKAALQAAQSGKRKRVIAAFQPHTFTRTQAFYKEFAKSFDDADVLIVTDVYPAREKPIEGITGKLIADTTIASGHKEVYYCPTFDEVQIKLKEILQEGDMFITLGAGNICDVGTKLISGK